MNSPRWFGLFSLALASCLLALPAQAARVALVIGNATYPERPLKNPTNDAQDLAAALTASGFKVTLKQNLGADAMKEAISEFGDALRRDGDTGLFYFSGHGVQTPKGNYLLPVGRAFKRVKDVELFAVEARSVLSEMQQARNPLNILILDACRDSPLPAEERGEGNNKGLARMDAPSGSVIAFATAPGRTASDNSAGRNGLYTKHLIAAINTPGLRLEDVFKRVGAAVEKESRQQSGDQSPEEVMKLRSEQPFYFQASLRPEPLHGPSAAQVEQQAWAAAQRANSVAAYNAYLNEYPNGSYASAARVARAGLEPAPTTFSAGQVIKDCTDCPELVVIPAGTFTMGSSAAEQALAIAGGLPKTQADRESPQHSVNIQSFAAGKYAVTKGEFAKFVSAKGYVTEAEKSNGCAAWKDNKWQYDKSTNWRNVGFKQGDDHPVVCVSWNDAQAYTQWLSQVSAKPYRLLSEAEREYAARGGQQTAFWWGDSISTAQANYDGNYSYNNSPKGEYRQATVPVGSFKPNPFGLYNVHGNVWEWVQDCFHDSYSGAPTDGSAWTGSCSKNERVLRGGSWVYGAAGLRSAYRYRSSPDYRGSNVGFRLARTLLTP